MLEPCSSTVVLTFQIAVVGETMSTDRSPVEPLFHERRGGPAWVRIVGAMILALSLVVVGLMLGTGNRDGRAVVIVAFTVAGLVGIAALIQWLSVTVDQDRLQIAVVPLYRRSIPLQDVAEVSPTVIRARERSGTGIRKTPGRPLAVFQSSGPAARVRLNDGREYLVQVGAPEALRAAIPAQRGDE